MRSLPEQIPDVNVLLAMEPEELGYEILCLARQNVQNGSFHPQSFEPTPQGPNYPREHIGKVDIAVAEALAWLHINMLIMPTPGVNGQNGHCVLTRRGSALTDVEKYSSYRTAAAFPKSLLHPMIADVVWLDLARADYSTAVFRAFKAVEEAVRLAGQYPANEVGVNLMRKAFHVQNGPLTDQTVIEAEREALSQLFAGAMGSYKNPHSHRTVTITDPKEAQEMVMLASHLLRIVDSRTKAPVMKAPAMSAAQSRTTS